MSENERPSTPATPESLWKAMNGEEEATMNIAFTPNQLRAMARSRERESIWSRRIALILLTCLAGAFAYNVFSVSQVWVRLAQAWLLGWTCLLLWKFRRGRRRRNATESCASFLQSEFEGKRAGLLEIRRFIFLLIPPILASWWADAAAIRLRALGVNPSSRLFEFVSGPGPFIITGLLLILVWIALGLAAKKATRELEELNRRAQV